MTIMVSMSGLDLSFMHEEPKKKSKKRPKGRAKRSRLTE